ncbi:hypothetical protein ALI144C_11195 [Actinosynnema sp. ALI-1.44]|nr:hypothetical protein ALI144C_11195 [Actinosynnema sp. ALI-1.44]
MRTPHRINNGWIQRVHIADAAANSTGLAKYGRTHEQLKILPAATFVLGDTDADARQNAAIVRRQQVSGQTAIKLLSSCGTGTSAVTTRTVHCPKWTRWSARTPSPRDAPACGCTASSSYRT